MAHLDVQAYVRRPRITIYSGIALSIRLLEAAPADATPAELAALADMRGCAHAVQTAVRLRALHDMLELRPNDRRLDGAWASLHGHLASATRMVGTPEAARAEALLNTLFPEGLSFVSMKVEAEWIHSRFLLARIDGEGLADQLAALVTETCMANLRSAHAELGQVLGLVESEGEGESAAEVMPGTVGEYLAELAEAIAGYGRVLVGGLRRKQPHTLERFKAAVAPLDAHCRASGLGSEDQALIDIGGPLPPLPAEHADPSEAFPAYDEAGE